MSGPGSVLPFAVMRRGASRIPIGVRGGLALMVLALAAPVPSDPVLCRGGDGHVAIESRWDACCAPGRAGGLRGAAPGVTAGLGLCGCAAGGCLDVSVSNAVSATRPASPVAYAPLAALFRANSGVRDASGRLCGPERPRPGGSQVRDSLRATVLTS